MGKLTPTGPDLADVLATGSMTSTGRSSDTGIAVVAKRGALNVTIWGTFSGTVQIERSFDGGSTWFVLDKDTSGTDLTFTAPQSVVIDEPENGVLYAVNCTNYVSGTINFRLSA